MHCYIPLNLFSCSAHDINGPKVPCTPYAPNNTNKHFITHSRICIFKHSNSIATKKFRFDKIHYKGLVSSKFIHAHKHLNLSLQFDSEFQLGRLFDSTAHFFNHSIYNTTTASLDHPLTKEEDTLARTSFIK